MASLGLAVSPAQASQPPAMPSSVTLERSDGTLTATWPAAVGATGYHITYSTNSKQSWNLAAFDHPSASITINADNNATYVVAVRAHNTGGYSGWLNSPPARPWAPPGAPAAPQTPPSVDVLRADGTLTATWPAVASATGYHITYSTNSKQSWNLAAFNHPSASITINADNNATYVVAIRAHNTGGYSGWLNSAPAGPWTPPAPAAPSSVNVLRADGTLTATWPAVASATGYHITYSTNSKQSWNLAAFNHPSASITINADNNATYVVAIRARNAGGYSGWLNSPPARPWDPPGAPANLAIKPGDGYLDISWDAVTDATGYDIKAKAADSTSWHTVAGGVTATSHRYTTDTTIDYIALRARKGSSAGAWTEISRMPSEDLLTAYNGDTVAAASGASMSAELVSAESMSADSVTAASNTTLGQVTWGTITRKSRAANSNSTFHLNWTEVTGAEGYNFVCSYWGGWHWDLCGWGTGTWGTDANYGTVPAGQAQPLRITHFWRKSGPGTPGKYSLPNRPTMLAVRAVKFNDPSAAGPWSQTEEIPPFHSNLSTRNFSYTRGDGQITMSWKPNFWITGYEIDCATIESGQSTAYTRCATLADQDDTASTHSVTISSWTAGGTNYSIDNTKTYDIRITSTNKWSRGSWLAPLMGPITLTASSVAATSATLTLANYTGNWWLKRTAPADATCKSKGSATATGSTESLTGLSPHRSYTYKAYSDSACTNEIVSAALTTTGPSASNLAKTTHDLSCPVRKDSKCAVGFTTGSSAGGYTLAGVVLPFVDAVNQGGDLGDIVVTLHASEANTGGDTNGPASTARASLSGSNPSTAGDYAYTCTAGSNDDCSLQPSTTYFVQAVATEGTVSEVEWYQWLTTLSEDQDLTPSGNGWSIADELDFQSQGTWNVYDDAAKLQLNFTANPHLAASGVGDSTATLTLTDYTGNWWLKPSSPAGAACKSKGSATATGSTESLSDLWPGRSYTYTAYSDSACTTEIASAAFTTTGIPSVSNLSETSSDTDLALHGGISRAWETSFTTGPNATGYTLNSVTVDIESVGSSPGTLTAALFGTGYYNLLAASANNPNAVAGAYTFTCSSSCALSANTSYRLLMYGSGTGAANAYTWSATTSDTETNTPSGLGWTIADTARLAGVGDDQSGRSGMFKVTTTPNATLAASNITATGATLSIDHHNLASWYYKATTGPHTACQGPVTGHSATLTGLTANSNYTYSAYSDSTCTTTNRLATATAFTTPAS